MLIASRTGWEYTVLILLQISQLIFFSSYFSCFSDLKHILGPSFVVDSACSSTLLALEMAFKAIRNGECDSAIVGGCHVCLHPALLLHLLKVGVLNPKGESKVFDEDGNVKFTN